MKNNTINTLFVLILFSVSTIGAQEFDFTTNSVTAVFDKEGMSKDEIYASINKWISLNYNSANDVIQMNDKDAGTLIVKGINTVYFTNPLRQAYPNYEMYEEFTSQSVEHTLEVNVKNDKFRLIQTITRLASVDPNYDFNDNIISLTEPNLEAIRSYTDQIESLLKSAFVGKKKRALVIDKTTQSLIEMNTNLKNDIILKFDNINNAVSNKKKDDW